MAKQWPGGAAGLNNQQGDSLAEAQAAYREGLAAAHAHDDPVAVGSPVQPDIRQITPVDQMGMGYREGTEDDAW
jgi:hypothetical protein